MTIQSHKSAVCMVIGLTVMAALLLASNVGGKASSIEISGHPTLSGRSFQCDPEDGNYRVALTWGRQMDGESAWLGTVTVRQGNNIVINNKPIQVFDAKEIGSVVDRQFQAQDGSFYCSKLSIPNTGPNAKNSVTFSGCRSWVLGDHFCKFPRF